MTRRNSAKESITIATNELDLDLVSMNAEFLQAMMDGQGKSGAGYKNVKFWKNWTLEADPTIRVRLLQLQTMPELQPWLLRAIVRQSDRQMVGHVGFHTPPGPQYLQDIAPYGVEIGYSTFRPYRRCRYASTSVSALINWAQSNHGVNEFVASINRENLASKGLAAKIGFKLVHDFLSDDPDQEDLYLLRIPANES